MSLTIYTPGDIVRLTAAFALPDGTPADPTQLLVEALAPDGVVIPLTSVPDTTGVYHADILVVMGGIWRYRWVGTGAAAAALEDWFRVSDSAFPLDVFTQPGGGGTSPAGYDLANYQPAGYEMSGYNVGG